MQAGRMVYFMENPIYKIDNMDGLFHVLCHMKFHLFHGKSHQEILEYP